MGLVFVILFVLLPGFLFDFWNKYGPSPDYAHPPTKPTHPEPHRDPKTGKIVIENSKQYYEDIRNHGAYQAQQWVNQGKYNLTPDEVEKKMIKAKEDYESMYKLVRNK